MPHYDSNSFVPDFGAESMTPGQQETKRITYDREAEKRREKTVNSIFDLVRNLALLRENQFQSAVDKGEITFFGLSTRPTALDTLDFNVWVSMQDHETTEEHPDTSQYVHDASAYDQNMLTAMIGSATMSYTTSDGIRLEGRVTTRDGRGMASLYKNSLNESYDLHFPEDHGSGLRSVQITLSSKENPNSTLMATFLDGSQYNVDINLRKGPNQVFSDSLNSNTLSLPDAPKIILDAVKMAYDSLLVTPISTRSHHYPHRAPTTTGVFDSYFVVQRRNERPEIDQDVVDLLQEMRSQLVNTLDADLFYDAKDAEQIENIAKMMRDDTPLGEKAAYDAAKILRKLADDVNPRGYGDSDFNVRKAIRKERLRMLEAIDTISQRLEISQTDLT